MFLYGVHLLLCALTLNYLVWVFCFYMRTEPGTEMFEIHIDRYSIDLHITIQTLHTHTHTGSLRETSLMCEPRKYKNI